MNILDNVKKDVKTILNWREAIVIIGGIFTAGIISVIAVTNYFDDINEKKFLDKTAGLILEQRVMTLEDSLRMQTITIETIKKQKIILIKNIILLESKI